MHARWSTVSSPLNIATWWPSCIIATVNHLALSRVYKMKKRKKASSAPQAKAERQCPLSSSEQGGAGRAAPAAPGVRLGFVHASKAHTLLSRETGHKTALPTLRGGVTVTPSDSLECSMPGVLLKTFHTIW